MIPGALVLSPRRLSRPKRWQGVQVADSVTKPSKSRFATTSRHWVATTTIERSSFGRPSLAVSFSFQWRIVSSRSIWPHPPRQQDGFAVVLVCEEP